MVENWPTENPFNPDNAPNPDNPDNAPLKPTPEVTGYTMSELQELIKENIEASNLLMELARGYESTGNYEGEHRELMRASRNQNLALVLMLSQQQLILSEMASQLQQLYIRWGIDKNN